MKAVDAAGNLSDPSNTASATVPDTTKPTAPGNLDRDRRRPARSRSAGRPSTDNVGVTGYRVFRGARRRSRRLGATTTLHRHGPRRRPLQLHGAGRRRGGQPLRPEQHGDRDGARHDQADRARHLTATGAPARSRSAGRPRPTTSASPATRSSADDPDRDPRRDGTSYTDTGLAAGHLQLHGAGRRRRRQPLDPSNTASATVPDTTKPSAPGNLTRDRRHGQVALELAGLDRQRRRHGLQVFRGGDRRSRPLGGTPRRTRTRASRPGTYSYTVKAVDAAGQPSDPSNTASATVPDTTKPTAPRQPDRELPTARARST